MKLTKMGNREEWLKWRHDKIGASDSNIIMGVSPYTSRTKLMLDKALEYKKKDETVNKWQQENILDKGFELEKELINQFKHQGNPAYRFNFEHDIVATSKVEWMIATLDGVDTKKKTIWECKIISEKIIEEVIKKNQCPEKYYPQIQHQLKVTGYEQCLLTMSDIGLTRLHNMFVKRNDEYIKIKLMKELRRFRRDIKLVKEYNQRNK